MLQIKCNMSKNKKKQLSWTLKPLHIFCLVLVFFIGMCWSFILGLFIGRGYNPPFIENKKEEYKPEVKNNSIIPSEKLTFLDNLRKIDKKRDNINKHNNKVNENKKYIFIYQCGSFKHRKDAEESIIKLSKIINKYEYNLNIEKIKINNTIWNRVILKVNATDKENQEIQKKLKENKINFFLKNKSN